MKKDLSLFRRFLCTVLLACIVVVNFAQSKKVTGTVTDKDNFPLAGATVQAKGANVTVQTSSDGTFNIEVPSSTSALIFSYVGYDDKEVSIGASNQIQVSLVTGAKSLQDVVVVGYGTRRKSDLTGAVG